MAIVTINNTTKAPRAVRRAATRLAAAIMAGDVFYGFEGYVSLSADVYDGEAVICAGWTGTYRYDGHSVSLQEWFALDRFDRAIYQNICS